MNLGEFIIKIGTQGDTKELDKAIDKLKAAEKETRRQIKLQKELNQATTEHEKALIKENYAQQIQIDKLENTRNKQIKLNASLASGVNQLLTMKTVVLGAVVALDRMGNSLLKANQMYMTFGKQTDMSITRLNRMTGVAKLSGMNLSTEQVAGDLQGLQQKLFNLGLTGEGSGIFAQLGINPLGMKSDQFIEVLRNRTRGMSGTQKSYILSQLGLSQEWLNVLDLSNEKFAEYVKMSKELQLSEEERKKLSTYTFQQQKNNMRWELAKQKFLISVMPAVQKLMDFTSKIALDISKWMEANPRWIYVLKDILLLIASGPIFKTITALTKLLTGGTLFKGVGALLGMAGIGTGAKPLLGKTFGTGLSKIAKTKGLGAAMGIIGKRAAAGLGALGAGPIGAIFSIAMGIWTIVDLIKLFTSKEDEDSDMNLEPAEGDRYQYHNIKSTMTNNFFNNPQPQAVVVSELDNAMNRFLANQYR